VLTLLGPSGGVRWTTPLAGAELRGAWLLGNQLVVATWGGDARRNAAGNAIVAIDVATGRVIWQHAA
jgi:outer membrane protein assembly factor BamB